MNFGRILALGGCCAISMLAYSFECKQVFKNPRFSRGDTNVRKIQEIDDAAWIWMPGRVIWGVEGDSRASLLWEKESTTGSNVFDGDFFRFRNRFRSDGTPLRLDISADERFILLLDGKELSRGPHRGMVEHWYYQSYEITGLDEGEHTLEVVVWQLGRHAPMAQLSYRGGFILKAEGAYDDLLTTGKGDWLVAPLVNTRMTDGLDKSIVGAGSQSMTTGTSFITEEPSCDAWTKAGIARRSVKDLTTRYCSRTKGWMLFPTERPDQIYESKTPGVIKAAHEGKDGSETVYTTEDAVSPWVERLNSALKGEKVVIPANTAMKAVWYLDDYYCAYPELVVSGGKGAKVTWRWAETLVNDSKATTNAGRKGKRDEFVGKMMGRRIEDVFESRGISPAFFTTPWWRSGSWCELSIETLDEPLTINRLAIGETRYPLEVNGSFECDDLEVSRIDGICRRTMEMCMHEMLFDCPYYEQQMYPGDTRIQLNILNALTRDKRMNRFALGIYDYDRRDNGMVAMNFPTRGTQESATYTMCWIMMFRDYMMWHDDMAFLKVRMPGVRNALMGLAFCENDQGLLENLPGWSFMDTVNGECPFKTGIAPCGNPGEGASALNNLQYLIALQSAAAVDEALGEKLLAAHWNEKIARLKKVLMENFWDEERGALADTVKKDRFSEHAQCMAIIAGLLAEDQQERAFAFLTTAEHISRASTYFSYYLFDTYSRCGRSDLIYKRLAYWRKFLSWGAKTTLETQASDSRSDCHAWSACPIYFWHTAFAGIMPSSPFFRTVRVAPQPAGLKRISAKTPHPKGVVETQLEFADGGVSGTVILPAETTGVFIWNKCRMALKAGKNAIDIP